MLSITSKRPSHHVNIFLIATFSRALQGRSQRRYSSNSDRKQNDNEVGVFVKDKVKPFSSSLDNDEKQKTPHEGEKHDHSNEPIAPNSSSKPSSDKQLILQLLKSFKQTQEVRQYVKYYGSAGSDRFAVIRISGDVLNCEEHLDSISSALCFLHKIGLLPIVVHGAGIFTGRRAYELSSRMKGGGTAHEVSQFAVDYMKQTNATLVQRVNMTGEHAVGFTRGIFTARPAESWDGDPLLKSVVGNITALDLTPISNALQAGHIPICASLGDHADVPGTSVLSFSTHAATRALAKAIMPLKVTVLRPEGPILTLSGEAVDKVSLNPEFPAILERLGEKDRKQVEEIADLLAHLPPGAGTTYSVTAPDALARELFTHKGGGTLVVRGEKIHHRTSLEGMDLDKLRVLIEDAFRVALPNTYFDSIKPRLHHIFVAGDYRGVAIVTRELIAPNIEVPYLDKFAVASSTQGESLGELLWKDMVNADKKLFWRSRATNPVNSWYFEHSDGAYKSKDWTVFWKGLEKEEIMPAVQAALGFKATFTRSR